MGIQRADNAVESRVGYPHAYQQAAESQCFSMEPFDLMTDFKN